MKVSEFIENLQQHVRQNPGSENFDVVLSKDAEGNGFSLISDPPFSFHFFQPFNDDTDRGDLDDEAGEFNSLVLWPS